MSDTFLLFKIITGAIATSMLFSGFLLIFKQFLEKRYRPSVLMALSWLGFMLEALFGTVDLIIRNTEYPNDIYLKLSYMSLTPAFLGVLALVDTISRDNINTPRFVTLVFLLGINTVILLMPLEEIILYISYYIVISIGIFISLYSLSYFIKIFLNVPANLKRAAGINLIGSFTVSVLYILLNIIESIIPDMFPPVSRLVEASGALIQTMVLYKFEQLFYILPFKVQRLIVYDTRNGISLFTHDWFKEQSLIDESIFSGVLQGMSLIVNESLQKGHVREIKMERGVLLISHDNIHPLAFVIITSKFSQVLNEGLAAFRRKFIAKFKHLLDKTGLTDNFNTATNLVSECFMFVPQFS